MNLEPVRRRVLADAHAEADATVAAARARAAGRLAEARRTADALAGEARAAAARAAEADRVRTVSRVRRAAQERVLEAQGDALRELRARVLEGVRELPREPEYRSLRARLAAAARAQLGDEVELEEPADGGLVGRSGDREVDYSLPALAERCLSALRAELEQLWR
jgi:vacuolar-type H+-ATPase subunit E/Vma4